MSLMRSHDTVFHNATKTVPRQRPLNQSISDRRAAGEKSPSLANKISGSAILEFAEALRVPHRVTVALDTQTHIKKSFIASIS